MRDVMLIFHMIGLAMGIGTSFAFLFIGIASAKMEENEARKFRVNSFSLIRMGHIGLGLLILSGGYLMTPHWKTLTDTPILMAKLLLVVALIVFIGFLTTIAGQIKKGNAKNAAKMPMLGRLSLLTGLTIIVLAVLNFH
jgi:uncharacterized membrane protein